MFCTKCGKPLEPGATVCSNCGKAVSIVPPAPVAAPAPAAAPAPQAPAVAQPAPAAPVAAEKQSKAPKAPKAPKPPKAPKAPKPPKEKKPLQPGRLSAGARVGAVLLSILLCACLLFAGAVTILRGTLSGNTLSTWIKNANLTTVSLPVETGFGQTETVSLPRYLSEIAQDSGLHLSERDVANMMAKYPLTQEFEEMVLSDYQNYLLGKPGAGQGITPAGVASFVAEHQEDICWIIWEETGQDVDPALFDAGRVEANLQYYIGDVFSIQSMDRSSSGSLSLTRTLLSVWVIILDWVVCGVLAALLILLCLRRLSSALSHIGIPLLVAGLVLCVTSLAGMIANTALSVSGPGALLAGENSPISHVAGSALIWGAVMLGMGLALIIARLITGSAHKKRMANAAPEPVAAVEVPAAAPAPAPVPEPAPTPAPAPVPEPAPAPVLEPAEVPAPTPGSAASMFFTPPSFTGELEAPAADESEPSQD